MGNKNSNNASSHDSTLDDGGTARRRNKGSNKSTRKKNALSCPNLDVTTGGEGKPGDVASPDRPKTDEELDVKILRSFSSTQDILRGSTMISPEIDVDIKVYRRSTATLQRAQSSSGNSRSATLPRNMGRSRSTMTGGFQSGGAGGTGTMPRGDDGGRMRTSSIEYKSASAMARKKLNSTAETVEFGPDAQVVKKNLSEFEKQFVRHLTDLYGDLSEFIQLSALAIAVGPLPASCHPVSLWEYLNSDRLPVDLLEPSSPDDDGNSTAEYRLTIPASMFHGVMHIRRDRVDGQPERISLAQELFMCLAVEVAGELARMFEYQIGLLAGPTVVDILAKHAADCAMEYLKSNNRFMDLNTVVHGVIHGRIHIPPEQQKIISVIVGEREFKWLLEDIFKKPGLMKKKTIGVTSDAETLRLPWRFFTNERCDPATYGYRTVIMERYYATGSCRPSVEDEGMFQEEVDWAGDDVHRGHRPQRVGRLVDSNQNVELSSASWKAEKPPRVPGENVLQYTVRVDSAPPHSVQSPLYVPSSTAAVKVEATPPPPKLTVNCDDDDGGNEVEIRRKGNDDTGAVIRSKLSDDYEGGGDYRTSRGGRTNELDVSTEIIRQYSPIGEDGKCKTYRPRSALSGSRSSDTDPDGRNKTNRPQSALSGRVEESTDAQTKTFRPKSALSGRISETEATDGGKSYDEEEKRETINNRIMPDLLLYSTPKSESVQQEQYRNSEVSYSRPVEVENEFNRSDTLRASVTHNRASLQEGPTVIRPGGPPQPVARTPSGKVPPQPPVRKTPCISEQRTSGEVSPRSVDPPTQSVDYSIRGTQNVPEHHRITVVTETFPAALVTSSPIIAHAPVLRTFPPFVRDQRIVSEIFTEDIPTSPAQSVHNASARGVSMISPVTSDESYVIPGGRTATTKPVIQHPKPAFVAASSRVRTAPPPVAPKKKTGPAMVALASPEVISPTPTTETTKQDFMNFNDFLNVVKINDAEAVEPASNQNNAARQSHVPTATTHNSPLPPQAYNPPSQQYNQPPKADLTFSPPSQQYNLAPKFDPAYNPPSQQYNPPPKADPTFHPPSQQYNPSAPKSDPAFLDFNNFLHMVRDPSAASGDSNDASRFSTGNAVYVGVQSNGNRGGGGEDFSREGGTRAKSFVEVTQHTVTNPAGTRDSFVTEETVYAQPREGATIYHGEVFHPTKDGGPGSPGVLISDL